MKKVIKLKMGGKVVLTVIILAISILIYSKVGVLGELAQVSTGYQVLCLGAWFWLIVGQLMTLSFIWEG